MTYIYLNATIYLYIINEVFGIKEFIGDIITLDLIFHNHVTGCTTVLNSSILQSMYIMKKAVTTYKQSLLKNIYNVLITIYCKFVELVFI